MIQLDSEGYRIVDATLELLAVEQCSPSRLGVYTHAKEVLTNGCVMQIDCVRCSAYIMSMCTAISEVRNI